MNVLTDQAFLFLNHGIQPTSDRAKSALLDELKSAITSQSPRNSPYTEEQLDRMQRESLAAKKGKEDALEVTRKKYEAQRAKLRMQVAAKPAAKAPDPPASKTPHLDAFKKLTGAEASAFFKQHSKEISIEQSMANFKSGITLI